MQRPRLKIGVLIDQFQIPSWAWEMLSLILKKELAEIDFILINQSPKSSGTKSSFLYRVFSKLDRTIFKVNQNAFVRKDIRKIPSLKAEIIPIKPVQKIYSDWFEKGDLEKIKARNPDILIRLGFRILKGEILKIPTLGVWSYHHGDNLVNKGGPPCFWEVLKGWETTGSVLQILSEKLDDGKVIYRSWSRTDPLSVHRNANKVYWKSLYFIPRNIERINQVGIDQWKLELEMWEADSMNDITLKPPGNLEMIGLGLSHITKTFKRKVNESLNKEVWQIWLGSNANNIFSDLKSLKKIPNPKGSYLADPFLVEEGDEKYLFAEQFDYSKRKGVISFAQISDGKISEFRTAIEETFHLSYPFLFQEGEEWFMLIESSASKSLRLYKAKEFPKKWKLYKTWFEGYEMYDPTIVKKDGLFWLFVNVKPHPGASSFDELSLFYSEDLLTGDWISHPLNPIISDVRSSRPAGNLFFENGTWYRPAQDSAKHYGHQIRIQEIIKWDKDNFSEKTFKIISANWNRGLIGTHTINLSKNWIVVDSFQR
ncbi:hypothetical protein FHS59_003470 [Algoriphagus iocasae]|uniref:Glucosamine inositolphosphorylceramide transferase 1 N-terminal domain-containing protein n=1 Tax=Algoriphagus iocasae TaxID=1836499 RepID=A0A841MQM1_9BACT|nr:hypothetical protein [Algoriphagus iocasae]MBB6327827.1 hypothetical protein [Algoriphagus iocasae]